MGYLHKWGLAIRKHLNQNLGAMDFRNFDDRLRVVLLQNSSFVGADGFVAQHQKLGDLLITVALH